MDEILDLSALADLAVNSSTADVLAALKLLDGINRCAVETTARQGTGSFCPPVNDQKILSLRKAPVTAYEEVLRCFCLLTYPCLLELRSASCGEMQVGAWSSGRRGGGAGQDLRAQRHGPGHRAARRVRVQQAGSQAGAAAQGELLAAP